MRSPYSKPWEGRDYTRIPGYEGMTQTSARHNYLHELLRKCQGLLPGEATKLTPCRTKEHLGGCESCYLNRALGGDNEVCCNWRAEADPDRAIYRMEEMLAVLGERLNWCGLPAQTRQVYAQDPAYHLIRLGWGRVEANVPGEPYDHRSIRAIADHYGLSAQMDQAQEELAELIQAISKLRRRTQNGGDDTQRNDRALDALRQSEEYGACVEEIADCEVMLEQLVYLMQCREAVDVQRDRKLRRQMERIQKENGNGKDKPGR